MHLVILTKTAVSTTLRAREELLAVVEALACLAFLARFGLAAADGEDPEEAGGDREGSTDPDGGEKAGVDACIGVVFVANGFDGADDD